MPSEWHSTLGTRTRTPLGELRRIAALGTLTLGAVLMFAAPLLEGYRYRIAATVVAVLVLGLASMWAAPRWSVKDKLVATVLVVTGLLLTGAVMVHQEWATNSCYFRARYFPAASEWGLPVICPAIAHSTPVHGAVKPFLALFPAGAALLLALRRRGPTD